MTQVVWNPEWIRPYESPWSIFEKFCYSNVIKRTEMLRKFGTKEVRSKKHHTIGDKNRNLRTLEGFDEQLLQNALSFDLKTHVSDLQHKLESKLPSCRFNWLRGNLSWCDQCLYAGYHSLFHQFVLLHHCPIHLTALRNKCPNCNGMISYLLSDKGLGSPFTCKCGHRLADLSERWNKWSRVSTNIQCQKIQTWLNLSTESSHEMNLLFIPEYAAKNKNAFTYLIHAMDETYILNEEEGKVNKSCFNPKYQSWNYKPFDAPKLRTEQTGRKNSHLLRNEYKLYEYRDFYNYIHEQSRQVFKSIDKYIRETTLKNHRTCVERFQGLLKEDNKPFPPICPHAYAYVLWKQTVLGYNNFYHYNIGAYQVEDLNSFELINKYFTDECNYIFCQFLETSYNFILEKPWELLWLAHNITATLCVAFYRAWQQISGRGAEANLAPSIDYMETVIHDNTPFIIIKHPINLSSGVPIAFITYTKKHEKKNNNVELICPYEKKERKIDRSKEYGHTPIAYSMSKFASSVDPNNYKEEKMYIDKYVRNLRAPLKYLLK